MSNRNTILPVTTKYMYILNVDMYILNVDMYILNVSQQ